MSKKPEFNLQDAHKFFSAHCFNSAWDYIDKKERSEEENNTMITLALASNYHWTQREDCTPQNLSVGYWQVSRVYALAGDKDTARKYGRMSLETGKNEKPFYVAYAYEALARAEMVAGDKVKMNEYLKQANAYAEKITDKDSKKMLTDDLKTIK